MTRRNQLMVVLAAFLTAGVHAKDKAGNSNPSEWERSQAREKRNRAELRAEANSPGMSKKDWARVQAVLAARKARENRELARYEQYKQEQRLALAAASAPKTYVFTGGQAGEVLSTMAPSTSNTHGIRKVANTKVRTVADDAPVQSRRMITRLTPLSGYPDRFARRAAQEAALDRQDAALDAQEARGDVEALVSGVPFGVPVPGKPGYMSSPPTRFQGYIDVRDHNPGSVVVDPFTGQRVRVP